MRTRAAIAMWTTIGLAVVLMVYSARLVSGTTLTLEGITRELRRHAAARSATMSYTQIVITLNSGSTVTVNNVTGYVDNENYISFTGTEAGSDQVKDWEYNRSAFQSVEKTE